MGRVEIYRSVLQGDTAIFYDDGTYETFMAGSPARTLSYWKIIEGDFWCKGTEEDSEWWMVEKQFYPVFIGECLPELKNAILEKVIWDEK